MVAFFYSIKGQVNKCGVRLKLMVLGRMEGKEIYLIDFPTKSKSIPNNMIVYADVNTFDYIGNGLVD